MISPAYYDDVIYGIAKALYYERGRGAYFRSTLVGVDFFAQQEVAGESPDELINSCLAALKEQGIIKEGEFSYDDSGKLYTFSFTACIHLGVDLRLMDEGVPPYICPPANMILHRLNERFDLAVEIAAIKVIPELKQHIVDVVVFNQDNNTKKKA